MMEKILFYSAVGIAFVVGVIVFGSKVLMCGMQ